MLKIPAKNELAAIGQTVQAIARLHPDAEILVVDDGSVDGTASAAEAAGAVVLRHPYCKGNGAAIKTGARAARGQGRRRSQRKSAACFRSTRR